MSSKDFHSPFDVSYYDMTFADLCTAQTRETVEEAVNASANLCVSIVFSDHRKVLQAYLDSGRAEMTEQESIYAAMLVPAVHKYIHRLAANVRAQVE